MSLPPITAPVSRLLAVADLPASLAFYRDVLGFTVGAVRERDGHPLAAELVDGPVRIEIFAGDAAPDSTGAVEPRGSALLFFESADVAALRDAVARRGGEPGPLLRINWLKLRVFQLRDPDGHILWFGQSFHQPTPPPAPERQLLKALPSLPLADVAGGAAWYRERLGFEVNHLQADLAVMFREDVTLLLAARGEEHPAAGACYLYVRDADALHAELRQRGVELAGAPISRPLGLREFAVRDPEGNRLTFGQPFE